MSHPGLIRTEDAVLVVVDVQEKLLPAIHNPDFLVGNIARLVRGAAALEVPLIVSEQYPKGLGRTVPELAAPIEEARGKNPELVRLVEKTTFSCAAEDRFLDAIEGLGREQIIICGIEAHICVLQTAMDLQEEGNLVYVVADAIGSRNPANRDLALQRMQMNGIQPAVTESALYEMLHDSRHEAFKEICALVK
jgi:nicotinamidase-related amidase